MTKIIAFANHKAHCGKTTISIIVADALARAGYKILLVDLDPQANTTRLVHSHEVGPATTIHELLEGKVAMAEAVAQDTRVDGVDLIASTLNLSRLCRVQHSQFCSSALLKSKLNPALGIYDVVIVDTPPALDFLMANALHAADFVFVPISGDSHLSLEGAKEMLTFIAEARVANQALTFGGAILNQHSAHKRMCKLIAGAAHDYYGTVLKSTLTRAVDIQKAQAHRQTVIQYDCDVEAARQAIEMSREIAVISTLTRH